MIKEDEQIITFAGGELITLNRKLITEKESNMNDSVLRTKSSQSTRKRCIATVLLLCFSVLFGCGQKTVEIRNTDDGKLRIDEQHEIDFYLGNDEVGVGPITEQCLAIIGDREPDSVETNLMAVGFHGPDDYYEIYNINGVELFLLHYGTEPHRYTALTLIKLDANHVLESGIRIGSTEEELKRAYEGRENFFFFFFEPLSDDDTHMYLLGGEWYERYLISFKVNATTGKIESISYAFDE